MNRTTPIRNDPHGIRVSSADPFCCSEGTFGSIDRWPKAIATKMTARISARNQTCLNARVQAAPTTANQQHHATGTVQSDPLATFPNGLWLKAPGMTVLKVSSSEPLIA